MTVFMSYAHEDADEVEVLRAEVEELAGPVWLDRGLTGGQVWWDEILTQLRQCRLFVLALSAHSLRSEACLAELRYVVALQRPILAIRISDIDLVGFPEEIRRTQVIDFVNRDIDSVRSLAKAVLRVDEPVPLPDVLPDEPTMPRSYRDRFAAVFSPALNMDEQLSLFARLKFDIDNEINDAEATELLRRLRDRPDLSWTVRQDISAILTDTPPGGSPSSATGRPPLAAGPTERRSVHFQSAPADVPLQRDVQPSDAAAARVFTGHTTVVLAMAFSPDGNTLATGSLDAAVRLWDPATGTEQRQLTGHTNIVFAVAFSPDGNILATGGFDAAVRLWDPATGTEQRQLAGHTDSVYAVAFSPDGNTLATGHDKAVRLWDPATGTEQHRLAGHKDSVFAVAFSPDGNTLATGSADKTVRLWDPATGTEQRQLAGHTDSVFAVAFSPDGNTLATGSADQTVRLWDLATGTEQRQLTGRTWVTAVAYSPDGTLLASVSAAASNSSTPWSRKLMSKLFGLVPDVPANSPVIWPIN